MEDVRYDEDFFNELVKWLLNELKAKLWSFNEDKKEIYAILDRKLGGTRIKIKKISESSTPDILIQIESRGIDDKRYMATYISKTIRLRAYYLSQAKLVIDTLLRQVEEIHNLDEQLWEIKLNHEKGG